MFRPRVRIYILTFFLLIFVNEALSQVIFSSPKFFILYDGANLRQFSPLTLRLVCEHADPQLFESIAKTQKYDSDANQDSDEILESLEDFFKILNVDARQEKLESLASGEPIQNGYFDFEIDDSDYYKSNKVVNIYADLEQLYQNYAANKTQHEISRANNAMGGNFKREMKLPGFYDSLDLKTVFYQVKKVWLP